jgi:hypothetical protein
LSGGQGRGLLPRASSGFFSRFVVDLSPVAPTVPVPFIPESQEIGTPGLYVYKPILAYGSGRVYAWISATQQGLHRRILGYGFGTEQYVFVDRFYIFEGAFTENSFVGVFLELGLVGVLLLLTPFVLVGLAAVRAVRRDAVGERDLVAVGTGIVASGFILAFFQSYVYSVGNVGTVSLWIALFVTMSVAARPDEHGGTRMSRRRLLVGIAVVCASVCMVVFGLHERSREQAEQRVAIAVIRAAIGPSLTHPGPTDYVYLPGRTCLLWAASGRSYGLELCIDPRGRVIEGVDRRGATANFYSLVEEPEAARLHISPGLVAALIRKVNSG